MKKTILLKTGLFIFLLTAAIAMPAQEKLKSAADKLSTESSEIETATIFKREFNSAKTSETSSVKQSATYTRPTKEERFKRYASDAFGVPALIGSTFGATINQIGNDPPEWRRTAGGFGKRFASAYATNAIRNTVSYGLSETFKLDNRFEKSGSKNFGKRLHHVAVGSYTTRTKTGKRIPDFPHFAGTYAAAIIANEAWLPNRFGYQDGLRDGTISLGIRFGVNLLREFVFPK